MVVVVVDAVAAHQTAARTEEPARARPSLEHQTRRCYAVATTTTNNYNQQQQQQLQRSLKQAILQAPLLSSCTQLQLSAPAPACGFSIKHLLLFGGKKNERD